MTLHVRSHLAVSFVVLLEYVLRLDLSRVFLLLYAGISLILLSLFRWKSGSLVGLIRREFGAPHYVMVVGTGDHAVRIGDLLERSSEFGVRLVGFLRTSADDGSDSCDTLTLRAQYKVYPIASLPDLLQRQIIDEIIFAVDTRELPDLEEIFLLCDEEGVRTHLAVGFFPHVNSSIHLDRLGPAPLLTFSPAPHDEILLFIKRTIDVAIAGTALVVLSPIMLVIAALVKLTSPGP